MTKLLHHEREKEHTREHLLRFSMGSYIRLVIFDKASMGRFDSLVIFDKASTPRT